MNKLFIIIFIVSSFLLWKKIQGRAVRQVAQSYHLMEMKEIASTKTCTDKKQCMVIYITPWCGACERMAPFFEAWVKKIKNDPDYGIQVIVGKGNHPRDNREKAARYGASGIVDFDQSYHESLPIEGYPTMLLLDSEGKIVSEGQTMANWAVNKFMTREEAMELMQ